MPKTCDNASVGVLIRDDDRLLMFDRATPPIGVAPVAGHVFDDHASYEDAARAEVSEELGLTVKTLELLPAGGWHANRCRRTPGPRGIGHQWQVYQATVTGRLNASTRETADARWITVPRIQELARWTAAMARGEIDRHRFVADPGLEPIWVRLFADLRIIRVSRADLAAVEAMAAAPL